MPVIPRVGQYLKLSRIWPAAIFGAMIVAFAIAVLSLLPRKCIIPDDSMHMPAGLSYLRTRDFRLNQEHPPLIKMLSGLGLIAAGAELPLDSEGWAKAAEQGDPNDGTTAFEEDFFALNAARFERAAFWGRAPVVLVPMILAFAVWWLMRDLRLRSTQSWTTADEAPALLAVLLLLTEPNVMGDATMVQDDLAAATVCVLFIIALRSYLRAPSVRRAVLVGLAAGFGLITKFSLVVLAPAALLVVAGHGLLSLRAGNPRMKPLIWRTLTLAGVAYFILMAGYGFQASFIDEDQAQMVWSWVHLPERIATPLTALVTHLPVLLPKYFLSGLGIIVDATHGGLPGYLLGHISKQGWWYYFPVAFSLKTSLLFLILTAAGICWTAWKIARERWWDGLYLLLPPLIYFGLCATSTLNIGVRHFQPAFPFFAMMAASATSSIRLRAVGLMKRLPDVTMAAVALIALGIAISAYPNYLGYFNTFAGGPSNGWKLLSDSNAETGQEVKTLAAWLRQHGESRVTGLFIASEFIGFYGIDLADFPPNPDDDPQDLPRYVAIGVWFWQGIDVTPEQNAAIEPYRHRLPDAAIANSIFVYKTR